MTSAFSRAAQGLNALLRARPARRTLTVLSLIWVAAMLAPLLAMSFYAYPTHDDFPCVRLAAEAWAETGSFRAALQGAWEQAMYDYQTWQGTYVAMFVCAFQPMAFSMRLFWLAPFLTLTLLALSAWYLSRQLTRCVFKGDLCVCAVFYAALMTLLLQYVPGIRELVYWQSAIQYTMSLVVGMPLIGLLLRLHFQPCRPLCRAWRCAAVVFCAVALGGLPYPLALSGAVGLALAAYMEGYTLMLYLGFALGAARLALGLSRRGGWAWSRLYGPLALMVAVLGGFLYHLLFEGKSQYLVVYLPLMAPLCACALSWRRPVRAPAAP